MSKNRLNIITGTNREETFVVTPSRSTRLKELQAKFERRWLIDPDCFNPFRNCMDKERFERTWHLLTSHLDPSNKQVADIGCAAGFFSRRLRDHGAIVEAIDIAENALKKFKEIDSEKIKLKQDAMPDTTLEDHAYHLILCTELIAELPKEEHRLFFAELSRLIKHEGLLICSSAIDIDTEGGVEKLVELAQTEFDLLDEVASYHALYLRLKRIFEIPFHFIESWQNREVKRKQLSTRHGIARGWFWLHSTPPFVWFWYMGEPLTRPIRRILKQSRKFLVAMENICRFFWDQEGISHYMFVAKRRCLQIPEPREIPIERPGKKQVWE